MKNKKIQTVLTILFFGGIWGIVEATVGYVLHSFFPVFLSGTLMFPFVGYILVKAYRTIDSKKALIWIGVVAAAIKSVDFLMPQITYFKTLNPMIFIVVEALIVVVVLKAFDSDNLVAKLVAFPVASLGWRIAFLAIAGIQYLITGFLNPSIMSLTNAFHFAIINGLFSGLVIDVVVIGAMLLNKNKKSLIIKVTPLLTAASVVMAVLVTYLIK